MKIRRRTIRVLALILSTVLITAGCSAPANQLPATDANPTAAAELPVAEASPTIIPSLAPAETPEPAAPPAEIVGASLRYEIVQAESKARYRVREQLANLELPNDAVGETDQVTGAIILSPEGAIDSSASRIEVDLSTLTSDSSRRDGYVSRNVLQTGQYPKAVFVPTGLAGLAFPLPESGPVEFQLAGDLTIRDVTRPVTWAVSGTMDGDRSIGLATTSFTFAEFNLTQPRVPIVLSIQDEIKLELDIVLQRTGGPAASGETGLDTAQAEQPAGADAAPFTCAAPASLTPAMTEGPYYTSGAPERTSLLEEGVPGTPLLLTGYVLTADCQPVAGALVDFWQADGNGVYDNSGFTLRGRQYSDESGRYTLETVIPGEYPGRTPHIHVKVQAPGGPELTSQVFFPEAAAQNQSDRIFDPGLVVTYLDSTEGVKATFDFIIVTN